MSYYEPQYYGRYQTLPLKKTPHLYERERSVTPDITRGLNRTFGPDDSLLNQKLGIPTYQDEIDSFRVSPIDPRNHGGFKSSTPSQHIKSAINLDKIISSPTKSTMSNEELYAVIHKSKKKLNIKSGETVDAGCEKVIEKVRSPESGYLNKTKSPSKDSIDKRENPQTSRMDFKKLLLQKSTNLLSNQKKLSAVEQLKLSKEQLQKTPDVSILELSRSPRNLNRKFGSPRIVSEKLKTPPKMLSPRSQWRFASPRTDVLSSTIPEDCREDESPNSSGEKGQKTIRPIPIAQRIQAQRAQFFQLGIEPSRPKGKRSLETSF